jgi:hypothetical protein
MYNPFRRKTIDPILKKLAESLVNPRTIYLLLDGRVHYGTGYDVDNISYLSMAKSEDEAKEKGWKKHEEDPTCDAVWGQFNLDPLRRRFVLHHLRYDLPPVLKVGYVLD